MNNKNTDILQIIKEKNNDYEDIYFKIFNKFFDKNNNIINEKELIETIDRLYSNHSKIYKEDIQEQKNLRKLMNSPYLADILEVAKHPWLPIESLIPLLTHNDERVREEASKNPQMKELIEHIATIDDINIISQYNNIKNEKVQEALENNPKIQELIQQIKLEKDIDKLQQYSEMNIDCIKAAVASRLSYEYCNTEKQIQQVKDILTKLSSETSEKVLKMVAMNPDTPLEIKEDFINNNKFIECVALTLQYDKYKTPEEKQKITNLFNKLDKYTKEDPKLQLAFTLNPNTPIEILKKITFSEYEMPKSLLYKHPKAQEVLESLLKDLKNSNFEQITDLSIKNLETLSKKNIEETFKKIYEGLENAEENGLKIKLNNELKIKLNNELN